MKKNEREQPNQKSNPPMIISAKKYSKKNRKKNGDTEP